MVRHKEKIVWMLLLALLTVALTEGCAKQAFPSGGSKDTQPPQAIGSKPANESRNFQANRFSIEFDEYVVLKNADANVLISPPMEKKPEFSTQGKKVVVKLNDTLRQQTTYLFQFKEAIADFTEGNPLPSYEYVFSTGEQMDTMMLAGRVERARDGKPWPEVVAVSAFRPGDTVPAYVTRTDKQGNYAFHYIPAGSYRITAIADKNKNWLPDSTEAIGWDTTLHEALDSVDSLRLVVLRMSAPERQRQRVLKAEFAERGRLYINTLLPMQHPQVEGAKHEARLNGARDTLTLWMLDERCDSVVLVLSDEGLYDTLKLRYRAPLRRGRAVADAKPAPLLTPLCDGNRAFYDDLQVSMARPSRKANDSLMAEIMRMKDSSVVEVRIEPDSLGMRARIEAELHSGEEYRVRIPAGMFVDMYGHLSDSLNFSLTPKDYGTLSVHISNFTKSPLVVEVLDKRDTVVQQQPLKTDGLVQFTHLPEGDYRLRAVIDADSNGRWTTGDYFTGCQPEAYIMYEKTLQLREKWEMEERWVVGASVAQPNGVPSIRPSIGVKGGFSIGTLNTTQPHNEE